MSLNLEVEVDVPFTFDYEALAGEVVAFTIDHEGFPYEAEVNLTLTDNEGIHEINRMYRQIDAPTDVLSFPMLSYEQAGDFSALEEDYEDNFNPIFIDMNDFQFLMPPIMLLPPYTSESINRILEDITQGQICVSEFPSYVIQAHLPYIEKRNVINIYPMFELNE